MPPLPLLSPFCTPIVLVVLLVGFGAVRLAGYAFEDDTALFVLIVAIAVGLVASPLAEDWWNSTSSDSGEY